MTTKAKGGRYGDISMIWKLFGPNRNLGEASRGSQFEECCAMLPRVVASGRERLERLGLIAAVERKQTFST